MASACLNRVTGVAFDKRLEEHFSLWNKDYTEHPLRTKVCIDRCQELKLLPRCKRIPVRDATLEEIQACHTQHHYELLQSTQQMDEKALQEISQQYDYSYFHKSSFKNARLALGATIDLVEEVVTEKIRNGMAIIRPPGHHAMQEEFSGYCYYNNIAVAAQLMLDRHSLNRIIILDWDVHHGQGSQFLFYDDPRVMYISIHRYEHGVEWPCLRESDYDFIGGGAGRGYNINLPLNEIGCGNDEYLSMFFHAILPICQEFNPQLVLVSAGYDSALGCPEGEMAVTPACFAHFVNLLTPLASGKLALLLEGGYNLKSLAESAALSLRALLGDPTPSISPISTPMLTVIDSVLGAVKCLHPYWKSLCYPDVTEAENISKHTHPYPNVLQNPPKEGMNFYTHDTRPKLFPLLQECVGDSVMDSMEELNKDIDTLIKNTSLACPQYKLTVSHATSHPAPTSLCSSLCNYLQTKDLWKHCLQLDTPEETHPHIPRFCLDKSIEMVMDRTSEASLVITSDNPTTTTEETEGVSGGQECIASAVRYAKNNHGVKRMLVVQILDSCPSAMISENISGTLHITLDMTGCSGGVKVKQSREITPKMDEDFRSGNIIIPFGKGPLSEADILATFHLVVLPVAYEFCPDFVLFSWDSTTKITLPVMGVLSQYLHGLAQGKMLMLINKLTSSTSYSENRNTESKDTMTPSSDCDERETNLISHCASILLGERCARLSEYKLSDSTINVIKETLDNLKHHWKSLVYRVQIPKPAS